MAFFFIKGLHAEERLRKSGAGLEQQKEDKRQRQKKKKEGIR
jgi:hypothetical protein